MVYKCHSCGARMLSDKVIPGYIICYNCSGSKEVTPTIREEAVRQEPPPRVGREEVTPLVIEDLKKRSKFGELKYNTALKTFNGRDPLIDAYQEALDLCCYLKQLLLEKRDGRS